MYLDTNIFIVAFETTGVACGHAWRVLDAVEKGDIDTVTSELSLAELLSKPPNDGPAYIQRYQEIITSRAGLAVLPVDRGVLVEAARIRRESASVRLPDAIHLASAILSRSTHFLTSDLRLRGSAPRMVKLGPDTLDAIMAAP